MTIQPIVEGHGEVAAAPVLLRRLAAEAGLFIRVLKPLRAHRSDLTREEGVRRFVGLARRGAEAILVLFDADDDCAKEVGPKIQAWADQHAAPARCAVVVATREYEAWFLAAMESLRGERRIRLDAVSHPSPESIRDCKGYLEKQLTGGAYAVTTDQAALTATFDLGSAYRGCRSFRRMVRAFGLLAMGARTPPNAWPPPHW